MKKRLFEQFDKEFIILCECPSCCQRDRVVGILDFLVLSLVISASQYRFLCQAVCSVL